MLWAADEAIVEWLGGEIGVPLDDTVEFDLSLADSEGTGSH